MSEIILEPVNNDVESESDTELELDYTSINRLQPYILTTSTVTNHQSITPLSTKIYMGISTTLLIACSIGTCYLIYSKRKNDIVTQNTQKELAEIKNIIKICFNKKN
jgi:hypothetical protein